MRFPFGRSGFLAAAAVAGAVVYWRASAQRRARVAGEIDDAIAEGREATERLLRDEEADSRPFDER